VNLRRNELLSEFKFNCAAQISSTKNPPFSASGFSLSKSFRENLRDELNYQDMKAKTITPENFLS
jgi:hypothetical protein